MGASESTLSEPSVASYAETANSNSPFILKLYSKQFETEEEARDETNLYLDGYGDDESDISDGVETHAETSPPETLEDDDYPLETVSANVLPNEAQNIAPPPPPSPAQSESVQVDIREAFESAKNEKLKNLESKYPSMPMRASPCEAERASLMQCYKEHEDILNCRELVGRYSQCAKSATPASIE